MDEAHHWERSFQDAALDPSLWANTLADLADHTGSARAQLIGLGDKAISFNWVTHADPWMLEDFEQIDGGHADINFRIAAERINGNRRILFEADYDEAKSALRSDIYLEFCEKYQIPYGCQSVLLQETGQMIGFALLRTERDGRTTEESRRTFALADRAARTGVRMQIALEKQGLSLVGGMLGDMSVNCILLDRTGRVGAMTEGAERHMADRAGVLRAIGGRLFGVTQHATREIDRALGDVIDKGGSTHRRLLLARPEDDDGHGETRPFRVDFFRLQQREWSLGFVPAAAVVIRDQGLPGERDEDARLLGLAFGLTTAEASVALLLARGHTREQITAVRNVSNETLRVQVRNIYAKTGCNREAELVLLLAELLG
ncbi:helix-turn-helix transcriptional regulator [Sphingobium lignivorans]|uniref:DNA-binding CsgD family transcriptional regulator n=1 Tax=Sphingobium lignivorans TaxID=2735886 RepID=A0ABR6NEN9_9SPHN|nr:LuxR C-terminal-related transcriptional regulator [Sphingobium lignivorans]MBB5985743.1 DNA-binding CsgD family transcriptional regulator [Sphingobium lignivorans]